MENYRFTLPLLPTPGKLTTVYAVDGGAVRNAVLTTMATLLAERSRAGLPVLMIDWDTEAPGLHDAFGRDDARPGLLEYFAALRARLALAEPAAAPLPEPAAAERARSTRGRSGDTALDEPARARQAVEAVDWEAYVERVDHSRPLYLMRAGCCDDSYGERAAAADWEGLFATSPSLFRCVVDHLARRFSHVLVASRGGRSAAVSVCTSLLADRLVTLFSPSRRSLDGACGVVRRAVEYRASHEEAQRPLLVYPVPVDLDGADRSRRLRWRHGEQNEAWGGYQSTLEQLLRESYAMPQLSLDSYFDHVQLQQLNAMADNLAPRLPLTADRLSLAHGVAELLEWCADGALPWQARGELPLARRIASARADDPQGTSPAVQTRLADDLLALGSLQQAHGRARQALASITEAATVQANLWGAGHADTRPGRAILAAQLHAAGAAEAALALYRSLFEDYAHDLGHGHADTLAARAGLAATLADCGQFDAALGHAEQVALAWRERCGLNHRATLEAQAAHAAVFAKAGEPGRSRMLLEQVLEGRERVLGAEHADTLATVAQLAAVLRQLGHLDSARGLQEQLLAARQRLLGADHGDTIEAAIGLAETVAAQCDLGRVGQLCGPLAAACQRRYGDAHPATRSAELQLASSLAEAGGLGASGAALVLPPVSQLAPQLPAHGAATSTQRGFVLPQESGFAPCSLGAGLSGGHGADADAIERGVLLLEQMEDRAAVEARELADRLREPVMMATVAPLVRARGVRAIVDVYFHQGDTDALIAFMQEQRPVPIR